jgi:hypothetical protein
VVDVGDDAEAADALDRDLVVQLEQASNSWGDVLALLK